MALPTRQLARQPAWEAVSSSCIARLAFVPTPGTTQGTLCIEWKDKAGRVTGRYGYSGCPRFIYQMMRQPSHGKAYHRLIKGRYPEFQLP